MEQPSSSEFGNSTPNSIDTNALASTGRATNEDENIVIPAERDLGSGSLGNDSLNLFDPQTPVIFTTNFLNCSVCNSLSKQGSKSNWLEPKRPGFQSKSRYRIATLDAKLASHNCPICALLYGIVLDYAFRFEDFQKTTIYVFEALCDGLVHIYGDPKTESRSHSRILVCYPEPNVQWFSCRFPIRKPVETVPLLDKCLDPILDWLSSCQSSHGDCQRSNDCSSSTVYPSRLLDLSRAREGLIKAINTMDSNTTYVALSYCWGRGQKLTLTSETAESLYTGILLALLPLTFQQAMEITTRLSIRYIWIDALCIQQDSIDDWRTESAKMGDVYANAHLVISADTSPDVDSGFLSPRRSANHVVELANSSVSNNSATSLVLYEHDYRDVFDPLREIHELFLPFSYQKMATNDPVFTRAWCLQERMSATRVVHFTSCEMVWECRSETFCECQGLNRYNRHQSCRRLDVKYLGKQRYHQHQRGQTSKEHRIRDWYDIVRDYSDRLLTLDADRLPAISALAKSLESPLLGNYLAGLWSADLPNALLWHCRTTGASYNSRLEYRRSSNFVAPTWSWASVFGPITWGVYRSTNRQYVSKVLDVSCDAASSDRHAQIKHGFLIIEAPMTSAVLHCRPYSIDSNASLPTASISLSGHVSCQRSPQEDACYPDLNWSPTGFSIDVQCILISRIDDEEWINYEALLVVPSSKEAGVFTRVGLAHIRPKRSFQSLERNRTILTIY